MKSVGTWALARCGEISTYIGLSIIAVAQLHLSTSSDAHVDMLLQLFNQYGPVIGGMLAGASTKNA